MTGYAILAAGLVLVAFVTLGFGAWLISNPYRTPRDRMREYLGKGEEGAPSDSLVRQADAIPRLTRRLAQLASPTRPEELTLQRQAMLQAGFRSQNALELYHAFRVLLALTLPLLAALALPRAGTAVLSLAVLGAAAFGYYVPAMVVDSRTNARKTAISRSLPDALDLMVSCTESGLGLDATFDRVAAGLQETAPALSAELQVVTHEVAAGISRTEALRRLNQRTGVSDVGSLVNVLIQADRLGTPVAQALRVHATSARSRRILQAEEKAARISPKLTVAMIVFLMPALFVVILGPAVVNIIRDVIPSLAVQ